MWRAHAAVVCTHAYTRRIQIAQILNAYRSAHNLVCMRQLHAVAVCGSGMWRAHAAAVCTRRIHPPHTNRSDSERLQSDLHAAAACVGCIQPPHAATTFVQSMWPQHTKKNSAPPPNHPTTPSPHHPTGIPAVLSWGGDIANPIMLGDDGYGVITKLILIYATMVVHAHYFVIFCLKLNLNLNFLYLIESKVNFKFNFLIFDGI